MRVVVEVVVVVVVGGVVGVAVVEVVVERADEEGCQLKCLIAHSYAGLSLNMNNGARCASYVPTTARETGSEHLCVLS